MIEKLYFRNVHTCHSLKWLQPLYFIGGQHHRTLKNEVQKYKQIRNKLRYF